MRKPFQFKKFSLYDGNSAMKLSTDAVLLGAFVDISHSTNILDIGTGCGVIALILAQRSGATITGIDPHTGSIQDAALNFQNSPWGDRLFLNDSTLQDFVLSQPGEYDHIVSNPPFFVDSLLSPLADKNISKHNRSLSFEELLNSSNNLLAPKGILSLIVPAGETDTIVRLATGLSLNLHRRVSVQPKSSKAPNRVLLDFRFMQAKSPQYSSLIIRKENNQYTEAYREFTKNYYLNF